MSGLSVGMQAQMMPMVVSTCDQKGTRAQRLLMNENQQWRGRNVLRATLLATNRHVRPLLGRMEGEKAGANPPSELS